MVGDRGQVHVTGDSHIRVTSDSLNRRDVGGHELFAFL